MSSTLETCHVNRRPLLRERSESILQWVQYLPPQERELMLLRHRDGKTYAAIANLMGRDRWSSRCVANRIKRLERRVDSMVFKYVALRGDKIPKGMRLFARRRFLHGLSLRRVADLQGVKMHVVRGWQTQVRAMVEGVMLEVRP
ncbi:MAG: sigma factor-like helix-turn-helix DNA-binding protein [Planctomycetota bacterium]